jgi:hypothetical protein
MGPPTRWQASYGPPAGGDTARAQAERDSWSVSLAISSKCNVTTSSKLPDRSGPDAAPANRWLRIDVVAGSWEVRLWVLRRLGRLFWRSP